LIKKLIDKNLNRLKNPDFKELISGSAVFFATKIFGILSLYLFSWYLSTNLRAQAYGHFAYLFTLINVITVFTLFGFDATLIKFFSQYSKSGEMGKLKSVYIQTLKIIGPLSILAFIIVFGIALSMGDRIAWKMQLQTVALIVPAYTIFQVNNAAISGLKEMTVYSVFKNIFLIPVTFIITSLLAYTF